MRSESDENPITFETSMTIVEVQWNHNGSLLAVAGSNVAPLKTTNLVEFYNSHGMLNSVL